MGYENLLGITPKDIESFYNRFISNKNFNIGILLNGIDNEGIEILLKIPHVKLFSFSDSDNKQIINLSPYCQTIKDTAIAVKNMNLIISNDMRIINLAGNLNKATYAVLNKPVNIQHPNLKMFINKKENRITPTIPIIKKEAEEFETRFREAILCTNLQIVKSDSTKNKTESLAIQSIINETLFYETQKEEYLKDAIEIEKKRYELNPENFNILGNLATFYGLFLNKNEEADKYWAESIKNIKENVLLYNYACYEFSKKNFEEFFKYFDARFNREITPMEYPHFEQPRWKGEEVKEKSSLLVHYEQGFGDTILFSRYLNDLKKNFKDIVVVVQPELKTLFEENFADIKIKTSHENIKTDYQIAFMSLLSALKVYPTDYKKKKWLKANKKKVKEFKKYFDKDKYNIGIFWDSSRSNIIRNSDLETFMPLAYTDNVKLYSLHVDKTDAELNYLDDSVEIVNLGKHFKDFSDTAAAIENCDLIISTDSIILNLAGALGKKTFGLFCEHSEWRWYTLDGEDTGLYKTVKPFKAERKNNFQIVIKQIIKEVKQLVTEKELNNGKQ